MQIHWKINNKPRPKLIFLQGCPSQKNTLYKKARCEYPLNMAQHSDLQDGHWPLWSILGLLPFSPALLTSFTRFPLTRQATSSLRLPFSQSSPYLDVTSVCRGYKVNIASRHNELKSWAYSKHKSYYNWSRYNFHLVRAKPLYMFSAQLRFWWNTKSTHLISITWVDEIWF